ncbi:RagB/SusD family nutrient uptake outer membrane protein [Sphingobacterium faecium]|uniref:RagB/SusD family nutrient uptake outer membrane protein n=1 Tax=Sphingobacterium faecium TaxID=34087 RepID=UPI0012919D04|nr:RagB/SusD family nutrient uptake outer membrane protein [Sphingobacterium faecium]MQP26764.1 RagB/SusD family nutrient uptake outer membrane protein [Sphingobacterium faecium]
MKSIKINISQILVGSLMAISCCSISACTSFLSVDDYFENTTQLDSVFKRRDLVEQYIRGAAGYLPNEGNLWTSSPTPFQGASDENFTSWNDDRHAGIKFLLDEITPFNNYFNNYTNYYQGIRRANLVLQRINEVPDISDVDRRDFMGRCYFLRGYYSYMLLLQYGPFPIVPEAPFAVDAGTEEMSIERNTYDECVDYISENMEKANEFLLDRREASADMNVPDKGAALATMSRVLLYAASPWYNGNHFYADWTRKDGKHFINQNPDNSKWGKAAVAAKRVMDLNRYKLYIAVKEKDTAPLPTVTEDPNFNTRDFPNGAANVDSYRSFSYVFNGEVPRLLNDEIIYSCQPAVGGDSPMWIAAPTYLGGGNGLNLTQDAVDAFYMVDGKDINASSTKYPYPSSSIAGDAIGGSDLVFSGFTLKNQTAKMYHNREMRFYATVGFCHSFWPGTSYTGSDASLKNQEVTYYADGSAQPAQNFPEDYNRTGYTSKKYIHSEDNLKATVRTKAYPIFRYAEILLNYAEALNELNGSYTSTTTGITVTRNEQEILAAFNQIRYRAGLPGLVSLPDQATMRQLIKRERQIEFMSEGKRYLDLRRWGQDAMDAYNRPVRGMNVKARKAARKDFYTVTVLTDKLTRRSFAHKHYFYPIPRTALDRNSKLTQNPGW